MGKRLAVAAVALHAAAQRMSDWRAHWRSMVKRGVQPDVGPEPAPSAQPLVPELQATPAQPWTRLTVRSDRDERSVCMWLMVGDRKIRDVQVELFSRSLAIDVVLEDGQVLQRVVPIPANVIANVPPTVSVRTDAIRLQWRLPETRTDVSLITDPSTTGCFVLKGPRSVGVRPCKQEPVFHLR